MNTLSHIFNNDADDHVDAALPTPQPIPQPTPQEDDDNAPLETQPITLKPITALTGATPKTPYPARRKYKWAEPNTTLSYVEAIDLFVRMRKQSPVRKNPERFRALTLAAESVEHLHRVKGVASFPGPRLHKLLCKAALAADWCPDISALLSRKAILVTDDEHNTPLDGLSTRMRCPSCGDVHPSSSFMVPMTAAQRRRWNIDDDSTRKVRARSCAKCRAHKAQRLANRDEVKENYKTVREYTRALIKNDHATIRALFEPYWLQTFHRLIHSLNSASHRALHDPTRAFMELRMTYLTQALETMEAATRSGNIEQYAYTGADWMVFLTQEERRHLLDEHTKAVFARKEDGIHTRHPAL